MQKPLISIIISVYNVQRYLKACLDSVKNQTYTNLEIILVDDGSTDKSSVICREFAQEDMRAKVYSKENGGLSSARNFGLERANGDYVVFVDSDDWLQDDYIEYLFNLILTEKVSLAVCNLYLVYADKVEVPTVLFSLQLSANVPYAIELCACDFGFYSCNKMFKRDLFEGLIFPLGRYYEDMFIMYKLLDKAQRVAFGKEPKYYYNRTNNTSITGQAFNIKKLEYFEASAQLLVFCQTRNYAPAALAVERGRLWHIAGFCRQMIESGFYDRAVISPLVKELRQNIWLHLTSGNKMSNKLFALCLCVNFKLTAFIYRVLKDGVKNA